MNALESVATAPVLQVAGQVQDMSTITDPRVVAVLIGRMLSARYDHDEDSFYNRLFTHIHADKNELSVAANMVNVMMHMDSSTLTVEDPLTGTYHYLVEPHYPRQLSHAAVTYMELSRCSAENITEAELAAVSSRLVHAAGAVVQSRAHSAA